MLPRTLHQANTHLTPSFLSCTGSCIESLPFPPHPLLTSHICSLVICLESHLLIPALLPQLQTLGNSTPSMLTRSQKRNPDPTHLRQDLAYTCTVKSQNEPLLSGKSRAVDTGHELISHNHTLIFNEDSEIPRVTTECVTCSWLWLS